MANLLASCWLFVEFFVIPNGFLKWIFLSFYIHPFFLFFCQIFLWLKQVQRWFLLCLCILYRITCFICSFLVRIGKRVAFVFDSYGRSNRVEVFYEARNHEVPSIVCGVIVKSTCMPVFEGKIDSCRVGSASVIDLRESMEEGDGYGKCKSSWLEEYLNSDHYNSSALLSDSYINSGCHQSESSTSSLSSSSSNHEFDCETKNFEEPLDSQHQLFEGIRSSSEILLPRSIEIQASEGIANSTMDFLPQSAEVQSFVAVIPSAPYAADTLTTIIHEPDAFEFSSPAANLSVDYDHLLTFSNSVFFLVSSEQPLVHSSVGKDRDSFHKTYTERMRFYDVLYQERLYGINAISNAYLETPSSWMSTESPMSFSSNKTDTKMLLRSLKSDLELAYVAELCLCWEALHYQYTKVEALANPSNFQYPVLFCPDVAEKFQEFQIRFERLTEEERSSPEGNRSFSYYCKRCPLHVPDVTGFVEENSNGMRGEAIKASEVLKAIEKCINSFWTYVKADYKKWKFKSFLRSHPPVEDPRDLELLYHLTKALHKKGLLLKNLEGKKNCWLRKRVGPLQVEYGTRDVMFTGIDLKLTGKVLKLAIISSSHLRWCQEKLGNIEFKDGRLFRVPGMYLFPSS